MVVAAIGPSLSVQRLVVAVVGCLDRMLFIRPVFQMQVISA